MSNKIIGIKQADGSFYPILLDGTPANKKLELTTVRDGQTTVKINLYKKYEDSTDDPEYVDTLLIENLVPHLKQEPSFQLSINLDEDNLLTAEVLDPETGKKSDTTVSLVTLSEAQLGPSLSAGDSVTETDDFAFSTEDIPMEDFSQDLSTDLDGLDDLAEDDLTVDDFSLPTEDSLTDDFSTDLDSLDDLDDLAADDLTIDDFSLPTEDSLTDDFSTDLDGLDDLTEDDLTVDDFSLPTEDSLTDDFSTDLDSLDDVDFSLPAEDSLTDDFSTDLDSLNDVDFSLPAEDSLTDDFSTDLDDSDSEIQYAEHGAQSTPTSLNEDSTFIPPLYNNNFDEMEDIPNRRKHPLSMIICIICTIICILIALGIFFFGPWPGKAPVVTNNVVVVEPPKALEDSKITAVKEGQEIPPPPTPEENLIIIVEEKEVIPVKPEPAPAIKQEVIRYLLRWGDTLWDLSDTYYRNPWLYPVIADANSIKNPDHIIAGNYINIPPQ